jgi:hypothetical protein
MLQARFTGDYRHLAIEASYGWHAVGDVSRGRFGQRGRRCRGRALRVRQNSDISRPLSGPQLVSKLSHFMNSKWNSPTTKLLGSIHQVRVHRAPTRRLHFCI